MRRQWTSEEINTWYRNHSWLCGFNYLPATAVNWTDMWQSNTFDIATIEKELHWAKAVGFNTLRTNLPYIAWQQEPRTLLNNIDIFLAVCDKNKIKPMITLFDDCGFSGDEPYSGEQKKPRENVHNSQAAASPGRKITVDCGQWISLEKYVKSIITHFNSDSRILLWDLYNEPTNASVFENVAIEQHAHEDLATFSHHLMELTFLWARECNPIQPLTVGAWRLNWDKNDGLITSVTDKRAIDLSDIISFHCYNKSEDLEKAILALQQMTSRPLLCTEWLARHLGSRVETNLPIFKKYQVGAYHWGLVKGKTQTYLPWPMVQASQPD